MNELSALAEAYKKHPEQTQKEYAAKLKGDQRTIDLFKDPDSQQGLDKGTINDRTPIRVASKIQDLSKLGDLLADSNLQLHCLILTCFALLLDIFGHVFLTLGSTTGYWLFMLDPRFISYVAHISQLCDVGGLFGGKLFGRHPFA